MDYGLVSSIRLCYFRFSKLYYFDFLYSFLLLDGSTSLITLFTTAVLWKMGTPVLILSRLGSRDVYMFLTRRNTISIGFITQLVIKSKEVQQ